MIINKKELRVCVINFSDTNGNFKIGQTRLVNALRDQGFTGDIQLYNSHFQLGCKPHNEVPYQFKTYTIYKAYKDGYDVVLYCDASIWPFKDITPCLEHIEENGHLFEACGFYLGQWCSDKALSIFGINRDEAFKMPLYSAGFTGLNFNNEKSKKFIEEWYELAKGEDSFKGSWNNNHNAVSTDPRCTGHRHDQSVASFLANKLEMEIIPPTFMNYKYDNSEPREKTIFWCQGV